MHHFCLIFATHSSWFEVVSVGLKWVKQPTFKTSGADALKGELRSQASACFTRIPPTFGGSLLMKISGADALKGKLRSQASACFTRISPTFGGSLLMKISGAGGSRTPVQKLIHYSFFHHSQCFNIPSAYRPLTCYRP